MKIKTRRYHIYYWARVLFYLLRFIPIKMALAISVFFGKIAFNFLEKYRKIAIDNIMNSLGLDRSQSTELAGKVFVNLAKNGAEWVKIATDGNECAREFVSGSHGFEKLDKVLSEGNGAIILASHFGNWELLMAYLRWRGYGGIVVGKKLYFHKYNEFISDLRRKTGVTLVYRDESPKKLLKELRSGSMVGMLADQDVDSVNGTFVDFFGRPAFTPVAPVRLAMASGAPIVPAFMIRKENGKHIGVIEEPIYISKDERSEDAVRKYTQAWSNVLEKQVRDHPEQWVWIHRRWKTRMPEMNGSNI